tara:strand:+ start:410 stop:673 length:264 start_codon:yes stop_codon:yes gene_type:complete
MKLKMDSKKTEIKLQPKPEVKVDTTSEIDTLNGEIQRLSRKVKTLETKVKSLESAKSTSSGGTSDLEARVDRIVELLQKNLSGSKNL